MSDETTDHESSDDDEYVNQSNITAVNSSHPPKIAYFYDQSKPPTFIEYLFGEPYHISSKYPSHQITVRLVLALMFESIVTGSILWLQIAVRYYLISVWSIGPSQFSAILSLIQLPFTTRIFYGLLIDTLPFFGYRRKSYLFLFGAIAVLASFGLIYFNNSYFIQLFCLCVRSFCVSFCDVIISAITVERSEFKSHSVAIRLQSLNYFSMYVVSAIGLIAAANIEKSEEPSDIIYVYYIYFAVTFLIIIGSILLPEQPIQASIQNQENSEQNNKKTKKEKQSIYNVLSNKDEDEYEYNVIQLMQLFEDNDDNENDVQSMAMERPQYSLKTILSFTFETFCRKIIFYPILFTFLMSAMPRSNQAMDYYFMYQLGFDSNQIGYLQIASSVTFLISVIIITIQSKSSNFSLRSLFAIWTFIAALIPYNSLFLIFGIHRFFGISDFVFAVFNTLIIRVSVNMLLLGTAVLYARICAPGIEGVFFTLLTSVATIGEVLSFALSSLFINIFDIQCAKQTFESANGINMHHPMPSDNLVCDFDNLWILVVAVNLTTLVPLMWIFYIPNEEQMNLIAVTLRESAENRLKIEENEDENEENDNVLLNGPRAMIEESDMIRLYFVCVDHLFPFAKHTLCASCIRVKDKDKDSNENEEANSD